jgi:glutamyl-tRNA synthetase
MFNFLALVGWSYDGHTELMTRQEVVDRFSIEHVNPSPAAFDYDKLDYFNGVYIRQLSSDDLAGRLLPFLERAGMPADRTMLRSIVPLIRERIKRLDEAPGVMDFFLVEELPEYDPAGLIPQHLDAAGARRLLESARTVLAEITPFTHDRLEQALREQAAALGVKPGQLFAPIRVAVCARTVAPPLFGTLEVLGRERVLKRTDRALQKLETLSSDSPDLTP